MTTLEAKLIKSGQLLTFEDWFKLNELVFTTAEVNRSPQEFYEEYREEILKNFPKTP